MSRKIGNKSFLLGLELGLNKADIQQIQEDYPHSITQCLMILFKWKLQSGDKATFRNLERAFTSVDIDVDILKSVNTVEDRLSCLPPEILDKQPEDRHLSLICSMVGTGHVLLGVELKVPLPTITQILREHPDNLQKQCFEIMKEWTKMKALKATFRKLEQAFICIGIDSSILTQSVN